ncbi:MAG TPA: NifU family protein [Sneathiellales bacterium]|nr:NifU family protein [Sneathiellales bacterium]
MFIQTEATPNPATLKFIPGQQVLDSGTADFPNNEAAERSSLARRLFEVENVERVFFSTDFISITKADGEWQHLKPAILGVIMKHYTSGLPVLEPTAGAADADGSDAEDDEVVKQIKELLDTRVRPAVAQDGGDIVFHGFENGVVLLHMQGACAGCPSSAMTLKHGIENMLRHYIPEVIEVQQI